MANIVPIPYRDRIAHLPKGERERAGEWNTVTQPWIKWFTYVNDTVQSALAQTADPFSFDFSAEDFWNNAGGPGAGSWDIIDAEADHPGIQRLVTSGANGDITSAWTPTAAAAGVLRWDQISTARFVFRTPPDVTTCRFEAGLSSDARANWAATAFEFGQDMVYFFYDTNVDTSLRLKIRVGGVTTVSAVLATPCPTSTWIDATFQRRLLGSSYVLDLIVDDSLVTTVTTGLFTDATAFGAAFRIGTRTAATRQMDIDLADIPFPTIGKRWDTAL